MNESIRSPATALVALGLLACGAWLPVPGGASGGASPDFAVTVALFDREEREVTSEGVGLASCPVDIRAEVSVAEGKPDSADATLVLRVDGETVDVRKLGPLRGGPPADTARYEYSWGPAMYGIFNISVTVQDGPDAPNRSVHDVSNFKVGASDLRLARLVADHSEVVIGRTDLTLFAEVENPGNEEGTANVDFWLDGGTPLGSARETVPAGGSARVAFTTVIPEGLAAEGEHTVTGTLEDLAATRETTGRIAFRLPSWGLVVSSLDVSPHMVTLARGGTVPVTVSAEVSNSGHVPLSGFPVGFFDGMERLATLRVEEAVSPGCPVRVDFTWNVPGDEDFGPHTISAGVDGQHPGRDALPGARLTVLGDAEVLIAGLSMDPASQDEGREALLEARVVNAGGSDARAMTVEFQMEDPGGGPAVVIGRMSGVCVPAGSSRRVGLAWTLPGVLSAAETRTVWAALDGVLQGAFRVTILDRPSALRVGRLSVPDGIRVGDTVTLKARVDNPGDERVEGVVVRFYDGGTLLGGSDPFDLPAGESADVSVRATIPGEGDAMHEFSARAGDDSRNASRMVGHRPSPANITILDFRVGADPEDAKSDSFLQDLMLLLRLENTGETPGTALVDIVDGTGSPVVASRELEVGAEGNLTRCFWWRVSGAGRHTATVIVGFQDRSESSSATVDIPFARPETDRMPQIAAVTALVSFFSIALAYVAQRRRDARGRDGRAGSVQRAAYRTDWRTEGRGRRAEGGGLGTGSAWPVRRRPGVPRPTEMSRAPDSFRRVELHPDIRQLYAPPRG